MIVLPILHTESKTLPKHSNKKSNESKLRVFACLFIYSFTYLLIIIHLFALIVILQLRTVLLIGLLATGVLA